MKRLSEVKEGKYKIVDISHTCYGRMKKLYNLGIFIGDEIEVIKSAPGPVIFKKGNNKIGIGYGIACEIIVEEIK